MFNLKNQRFGIFIMAFSFVTLVACGESTEPPPPVETHTIGGTVTGLSGTIVIRLKVDGENFENLTIDSNGAFTFENEVDDGSEYEVVPFDIFPDCPTFHIVNESGTAEGNVTTIEIDCT